MEPLAPLSVQAEELTVRLGDATILSAVSLQAAAGEFVTVIGPNGAGKTTLLRCLDGLLAPTAGTVRINGRNIEHYSRRHLARVVSFVPQADTTSAQHDVRSFVEMGRYPHVGAWAALTADDHDAVNVALEMTETAHLSGRMLASLSGGERQRVLIAAALAQGGTILLLDEPTSFLDYRHQVQIMELLQQLNIEHGLSIIAVSHDLNGMIVASSTVLALKQGRVVFNGPPKEALTHDRLAAIFDTPFELIGGSERRLPFVVPARNG